MARPAVSRPGTGGQLPRAVIHTVSSATAELRAELGEPWRVSAPHGAQMLVWLVDDEGTGIVVARLSGRELQNGETALGQVRRARGLVTAQGLQERYIVLTLNNSGGREYDERADFRFIEEAVREGWCAWTAWLDLYRLQREPAPGEQFFRFMRDTETRLLLADLGREVVWEGDRLMLRILSAVGAEERHNIKRRTHGALRDRWLYGGRGWAGSKPFGFRRNPVTKFLEVDPEQWPFVTRAHFEYAALEDGHGHGLARLSEQLAEQGCFLHLDRIRKVLRNRIYVDGTWSVTTGDGEVVPQRSVRLSSPIPEEVWQRNQQLLDLRRGKNTKTLQGEFCLNRLNVEHDRCAGEENRRGLKPYLAGRRQGDRAGLDYSHSPWVPQQCHGFRLSRDALERPVLEQLRELASCTELVEAWTDAGRFSPARLLRDADLELQSTLRKRRRALARQRERLERLFVDRLVAGEPVDDRDYGELVNAIQNEEDQLKARLTTGVVSFEPASLAATRRTRDEQGLRQALADVLTDACPDDAARRVQREALICTLATGLRVEDRPDGVVVVVRSPLVPAWTSDLPG